MISAIVAVDANWGIGFDGELLERIPEDMKRFRELTENNVVVMGRKTWDSLPSQPLPNRDNIIISATLYLDYYKKLGSFVAVSEMEKMQWILNFIKMGYAYCDTNVFIIGGGQIYEQLLPYCDRVYVTKIHRAYENVDTYFPVDLDKSSEWRQVEMGEMREYNSITYNFLTYERV